MERDCTEVFPKVKTSITNKLDAGEYSFRLNSIRNNSQLLFIAFLIDSASEEEMLADADVFLKETRVSILNFMFS